MPDLDSLIREVLSMVQEEKKKKNFGNNAYAASAAEAGQYAKDARDEYNKMYEPPGSTTALDRAAKLKGIEMTNTGAIDLEKTKSAGELARLRLANEGAANVANINLEGTKYTADQSLASNKYAVDAGGKGVYGDQLKAAITILESMDSSPEDKKMAGDFIRRSFRSNITRIPGKEFVTPDVEAPQSAPPVGTPSPISKPSRGAQSMTFETNMGTAKKPEISSEDLFYRRNPGLKKKEKESLFGF